MEGGFKQNKLVLRPLTRLPNSILSHTTGFYNKSVDLVKNKPHLEK